MSITYNTAAVLGGGVYNLAGTVTIFVNVFGTYTVHAIDRPNQVWAMDVTYIPMARGFVYLVAVLDWYRIFLTCH